MQIIQDLQIFVLVMGVVCTMEFVISYTHDLGIPSLGVCLFILFCQIVWLLNMALKISIFLFLKTCCTYIRIFS